MYAPVDNHPINAVMEEMNKLAEGIINTPAYTLEGLAFKARHAVEYALNFGDLDGLREDLDYDKEAVLTLAEDLCRSVGLDTFGRPRARGEG